MSTVNASSIRIKCLALTYRTMIFKPEAQVIYCYVCRILNSLCSGGRVDCKSWRFGAKRLVGGSVRQSRYAKVRLK